MFGSNNNKQDAAKAKGVAPAPVPGGHSLNSIVQGSSVEGTIKAQSDLRIDGTIKGKIFCEAKVIIGPTGAVEGEIRCQNAVIEGKFDGVLEVKELLNVRESAVINGDVATSKLIVQPGGVFNVICKMNNEATTSAPKVSSNNVSATAAKVG